MSGSYFIGLMSGTSTDGVDAVLADLKNPKQPNILAWASLAMPPVLRGELLALNTPGQNELHRAALAANQLAHLYAQACQQALALAKLLPTQVQAIGAHGQTVRHNPTAGYTLQLNAPALLAELTRIPVVADFRSRDIAAGGQGAPLVPIFHQAVFQSDKACAVLNLGGIANLSLLCPTKPLQGFDTGPANVLLDLWCQEKTGAMFDDQGLWAASGDVNEKLLAYLISSEPWLAQPPPKSTGRHLFNKAWLVQRLASFDPQGQLRPHDIQATLLAFTVATVVQHLKRFANGLQELLVCGGGALNQHLIHALQRSLDYPVRVTSDVGIPVQQVEALAFAWLAWAHLHGKPAGLPEVTGACHPSILGCLYPA